MEIKDARGLEEAADRILKSGTKCAVITSGSDGVFYKDQNGLRLQKRHEPLKAVSATGAGDSFTAAMVYAFLKDMAPEDSLELAMRAAEITLTDTLTVSPKISELTKKVH